MTGNPTRKDLRKAARDPRPDVRAALGRALSLRAADAPEKPFALGKNWLQDPSPKVRCTTLGFLPALAESHGDEVVALLAPLGADSDREVRAALAALPPAEVAAQVRAGQEVQLTVDGQQVTLAPDEIQVEAKAREGFAVAEEAGYLVALDTHLTEELLQEGRARDVVRRIQTLRKDAGFRIEDRITTYWQGGPLASRLFQEWGDYIQRETLSEKLVEEKPPAESTQATIKLEGESLTLGVLRT